VLTFFFTGVPPLEEEKEGEVEKEKTTEAAEVEEETVVRAALYTHPLTAARLCSQCHQTTANFSLFSPAARPASFQKGGMSPGPLVVERRQLCVECHKDKSAAEALSAGLWLHDTAEKGDCHACHDPHQSENRYLLLQPPEKICLPCHEEAKLLPSVKDKAAHQKPDECLVCHNPHLGKDRLLLKKDYKEVKQPVGPVPGLPNFQALPGDLPAESSVSPEKEPL
jgi:predicted CXXCH cytochrome family protein